MNICILGNGVIGTLYGSIFKNSGHTVKHLVREEKKQSVDTKSRLNDFENVTGAVDE